MMKGEAIRGPRLVLRRMGAEDAPAVAEIYQYNRNALEPYMPLMDPGAFTVEGQQARIQDDQHRWDADLGYAYAMVVDGRIMGRVALSNIVRGAWQNATLGYWVDTRYQGQGFCTEAVAGALASAFTALGLHRVQAAIMPHNRPSLRVVEKLGFYQEGLAPRYLKIHGAWQDHLIWSMTTESFRQPAGWQ